MSDQPQWFVMQDEQQLGPYTGEQLVEFATNGNITRESPVWTEGMEAWLPAGQIEGVFPAVAAPAPTAAPAPSPYAPPGHPGAMAPQVDPSAPYPNPSAGTASFGLWIGMFLGGIALMIIGGLLIGLLAGNLPDSPDAEVSDSTAIGGVVAMGVMFLGYGITFLSIIPFYITLFKAWKCLQPGGLARSTPGKAVGFMFIPFFNIYWLFQAINGLATDWNQTVETFTDLKSAPRLSGGVFLTFCIGVFLPPLSLIMMFPVVSQMCKGVNFFAYRPQPGQGLFGGGFTTH